MATVCVKTCDVVPQ